jgi:hypothetical protein
MFGAKCRHPLPPSIPFANEYILCAQKNYRWMEGIEGLTEVENGVDH